MNEAYWYIHSMIIGSIIMEAGTHVTNEVMIGLQHQLKDKIQNRCVEHQRGINDQLLDVEFR
jgi:hypothetical protein